MARRGEHAKTPGPFLKRNKQPNQLDKKGGCCAASRNLSLLGSVSTGVVDDYLALHPGMEDAHVVEVGARRRRYGDADRLPWQDEDRVA